MKYRPHILLRSANNRPLRLPRKSLTTARMPQLTLGTNLSISTKAPTPSPRKTTAHSRTTLKGKPTPSTPLRYGEMESSLDTDIHKLGVEKSQVNLAGGYGNKEGKPTHQPQDEIDTSKIDPKTKREAISKTAHPEKAKETAIAPTADDVDVDDPDHAIVGASAQFEADGHGSTNASKQHSQKRVGTQVSEMQDKDVSGKGPRSKKRAPSEDEGGVAGQRGKGEGNGKKKKDAYYVRE